MLTGDEPNRGLNTRALSRPLDGSPRKIHDVAYRMPGTISGTSEAAKNSALNGVSVRTWMYASTVPSTSAMAAEPTANHSELSIISPDCELPP
jgi:hypothetical protein